MESRRNVCFSDVFRGQRAFWDSWQDCCGSYFQNNSNKKKINVRRTWKAWLLAIHCFRPLEAKAKRPSNWETCDRGFILTNSASVTSSSYICSSLSIFRGRVSWFSNGLNPVFKLKREFTSSYWWNDKNLYTPYLMEYLIKKGERETAWFCYSNNTLACL